MESFTEVELYRLKSTVFSIRYGSESLVNLVPRAELTPRSNLIMRSLSLCPWTGAESALIL